MSHLTRIVALFILNLAMCLPLVAAAESSFRTPTTPVIPERVFKVTDFGAVADGATKNTTAFRAAVEACSKAGGGRVVVPTGDFLTGPFDLKSAMALHLEKGATIRMSQDVEDYPVNGRERLGFITATDARDVQISGEGTIDGQGEPWWTAFLKIKRTTEEKDAPRRPQLISFTRCERVRLAGFKTVNPPNTHCSLRQCQDVIIDGLTMSAPDESPNTDALNLNIKNAIIQNCNIATGDDNIVFLASALAADGTAAVENIRVMNCRLGVGHGLSIGSYTFGGIRNIEVENVVFEGTTAGIRMKAARDRGGMVENLTFKNITMKKVRNPIYITSYYPKEPKRIDEDEGEPVGPKTPHWRNITIENGTISECLTSVIVCGLPEQPVMGLTLRNLQISAQGGAKVFHASGVRFENVDLRVKNGPALTTFKAEVTGMGATPLSNTEARR